MNASNQHQRILLNKNATGEIEYCEACDLVEIAFGPVSVRLHAKDLALFSKLIGEAELHLSCYKAEKKGNQISVAKIDGLH